MRTTAAGMVAALSVMMHAGTAGAQTPVPAAGPGLPFLFEANEGQTDSRVKFLSRGAGHTLFLTPTEGVLVASGTGDALRMKLLGANPAPVMSGLQKAPVRTNYITGSDPKKWRTGVATYSKVRYTAVYPGIDLIYYGNPRDLEYDFEVSPGASPDRIRIEIGGGRPVSIDDRGDVVVGRPDDAIRLQRPRLYQDIDGARREIAGRYALTGRELRFEVGAYDRSRPLIIDPVFVFSTYLGGIAEDTGFAITTDDRGNTYVAGSTRSDDFPGAGVDRDPGDFDAFVAGFDSTGSPMFVTYLGGTLVNWAFAGHDPRDQATAIAFQPNTGLLYVTGHTLAPNFPTTPNAFQRRDPDALFSGSRLLQNDADAFVTVMDPWNGGLVYSTYLGGTGSVPGFDAATGIAADAVGWIYVSGVTRSNAFPTSPDAIQLKKQGLQNAFITVLNPNALFPAYSTYLGAGQEEAPRIAVDPGGRGFDAFVVAGTAGSGFRTTAGAVQPVFGGGTSDGFVARFELSAAGTRRGVLAYSTFLGGSGNDGVADLKMDASSSVYLTGTTASMDFPTTWWAFQPSSSIWGNGTTDAFVSKLAPGGSSLVYSTYLGGWKDEIAHGIAVDSAGNAYVVGVTYSSDFPLFAPLQLIGGYCCRSAAFVTKLDAWGSTALFSTPLGGPFLVDALGIAADDSGNAYLTGSSYSYFPVVNAWQSTHKGNGDAFVTKIDTRDTTADLAITVSANPTTVNVGDIVTYTIQVTNNGPSIATGVQVWFYGSAGQDLLPLAPPTSDWCVGNTAAGGCSLGAIPTGPARTRTLFVRAQATASGSISLAAFGTAAEPDPTGWNAATATATVN